ncbi:MAG: biotin/lipoyl-binding protein [Pseudomonadota bacterium]
MKRPSLKKVLPPLVILLAAFGVAAALVITKPKPPPVESREKAWLVSTQILEPRAWSPSLVLYGRVESLWSSELTSAVAADVGEVAVIEGDEVARGDLLVRLDERDARLLLAQREAEVRETEAAMITEQRRNAADLEALPRERSLLELIQAEVQRAADLVKKKVGSQSSLDIAMQSLERQAIALSKRELAIQEHESRMAELEARRVRAEALRDQALLDLERCEVAAPFDGRVSGVLVSPGKRVRVGDPLVQLYDTGALVVRAQLPSRYLPAVRRARARGSELVVQGHIDTVPVKAKLLRLAGEVSQGSGGVEALFEIEGNGEELQQGRFVRLDLSLPEQPGLVGLPPEAIYGTDRVYRVDTEQRMRGLRVERVGETRDDQGRSLVLVRGENLKAGDAVVTTQLPNAVEGLLVRVPKKAD